jgi:hypothetical protein
VANPNNAKLAGLADTVFRGESLRSMLLNAYGWWKVSQIMYIASIAAFAVGGLTLAGMVAGLFRRTGDRRSLTTSSTRPQRISTTYLGNDLLL